MYKTLSSSEVILLYSQYIWLVKMKIHWFSIQATWLYCTHRATEATVVHDERYTDHKHTPLHLRLCLMTCVSNYFKPNVCRHLSVSAHVCFYLGFCLSALAMRMFNGVCENNHLIVASSIWESVYVCLRACVCARLSVMVSLKTKLRKAGISRKFLKKLEEVKQCKWLVKGGLERDLSGWK